MDQSKSSVVYHTVATLRCTFIILPPSHLFFLGFVFVFCRHIITTIVRDHAAGSVRFAVLGVDKKIT